MAKKRPKPQVETPMRESKPKKRKRLFKQGDFVRNIEDESLIVVVTQDAEKGSQSFHGTCIRGDKRTIGEHDRFWLKTRFEVVQHINIECM